jgi:hypothetical protein
MTQDKASPAKAKLLRTFDRASAASRCEVAGHLELSERDSRKLRELMENPPSANAKLRAVAEDLP